MTESHSSVRRLVVTGLEVNDSRPNNKLPYRGTWLQIGHDQVRSLCRLLWEHGYGPTGSARGDEFAGGADAESWLMLTQIHLMELPNPDPTAPEQRPEHGGRDRHICVGAQPCRGARAARRVHLCRHTIATLLGVTVLGPAVQRRSREDIAVLAKCIHRTWQARTGRVRS